MKKFLIIFVLLNGSLFSGDVRWQERKVTVVATAYCPKSCCCGKFANGKTSTGRSASVAGVAVDPKLIPLGSYLDIPGYKRNKGVWIKADDVGGEIKGHRIDLRFSTHKEALAFGRKKVTVRVWTRSR